MFVTLLESHVVMYVSELNEEFTNIQHITDSKCKYLLNYVRCHINSTAKTSNKDFPGIGTLANK